MHNELTHYLNNDAAVGKVMAHARLLLRLSRRFEAIVPQQFRQYAHVANFKAGKIIIHADNGAVAAKIRQLSQRLSDEFAAGGAECTGIEVKVLPRQIPEHVVSSTQKPLSTKACGVLRSATENLPAGSLRSALEQLLASAAKRED
jgi:hypothetical protein